MHGVDYGVDRIPEGVLGQSYVFLSRSGDDFSDSNIIAGPTIIQVSLETLSEILSKMLRIKPLGLPERYDISNSATSMSSSVGLGGQGSPTNRVGLENSQIAYNS